MRKVAGGRAPRVKRLFKYYNQFIDAERTALTCSSRRGTPQSRETSVNRYTRAMLRTGRPQVDELIYGARVPVFLLDEHQVVRPANW